MPSADFEVVQHSLLIAASLISAFPVMLLISKLLSFVRGLK